MDRWYRKLSIVCFVVAAITLLLHLTGLVLRLTMDIRMVYPVDVLLKDFSFLKGKDAFIAHLLRKNLIYGLVAQIAFLLSQIFIQLHDVFYVKKWMGITAETQIKLLKENEKDLIGLVDRIVPLIALIVFSGILISEWVKTSFFMETAELTRRICILPNLTITSLSWALTFLVSLAISLIFLWYFRHRMLRIYDGVKVEAHNEI